MFPHYIPPYLAGGKVLSLFLLSPHFLRTVLLAFLLILNRPPRSLQAAAYARSVLLKYSPYVFSWLLRDPVMTGDFDNSESEILLANVFLR